MRFNRIGLVLSGGGAKGAYQAGVMRALAEAGVEIQVISGASIGALNGAMIASAPGTAAASRRLGEVWATLAECPPLQAHLPSCLRLAAGLATVFGMPTQAARLAAVMSPLLNQKFQDFDENVGLLSDAPLCRLLDRYLDPGVLERGNPLYAALYQSHGWQFDLAALAAAEIGAMDTGESEYKLVQALPEHERKECLLASAALPLVFARRKVEGKFYSDGGIGGWQSERGNTPMAPLLGEGCDLVIVSHLSNGSLWKAPAASDGPAVIELRPRTPIARGNYVSDLLGFKPELIDSWMKQGYEDSRRTLVEVADLLRTRASGRLAQDEMIRAVGAAEDSVASLGGDRFSRLVRRDRGIIE